MPRCLLVLLRVGVFVALAPVLIAGAQEPRTPWGDPDLQGTWTNHHGVPLERPAQYADREFLTDEELAALEAQTLQTDRPVRQGDVGTYNSFWGERRQRSKRTSLIIDPSDGRLPLAPDMRSAINAGNADRRAGSTSGSWEDRDTYERCITRGLPGAMMPGFYNHNYQILQTQRYVAILVEMIHDARIVPLDGRPHVGSNIRQWLGDSRGHWEGDTLVVETTNFNGRASIREAFAFGTGQTGRVIERFRRVDVDTIDYEFTVDDPATFTRPWTVSAPMERVSDPIFEYACHEGNYGLTGVLGGARAGDADLYPK